MKSFLFYPLLYLRPIANILLKILGFIGIFLAIAAGVAIFAHEPASKHFIVCGFGVFVSFGSFILRQKYVSVLIALQPEGMNYTFFD
jgi:hypothetical protein